MTDTPDLRELILQILTEVLEEGRYSHIVIRQVLQKYQYLEKTKRAFLTRVSEGTIQYCLQLDYIIDRFSSVKVKKMKPVIRNILRMGVYQIKFMDSVPDAAACNEAVRLAKKKGFSSLSGFVNGVLREIVRKLPDISYPLKEKEPVRALSVLYSMPERIVEKWMSAYKPERTEELLGRFLEPSSFTIRTNLTKTTPEQLEQVLREEGVRVHRLNLNEYPLLTYAFAVDGVDSIAKLHSFRDGLFYIQDISSMMAAEFAKIKEGDYVIDVCAAPGGKSLHLAERLCGTGMVEARDLTPYKIELMEENIRRSGLTNIRAVRWDATVRKEDSVQKADIVLADLPCSGLGVLRKKTDIKYRFTKDSEAALIKLQRDILDTVWDYVRPGGTLVYSTCTINRAENEDNARWFLENHTQFSLQQEQQMFPGAVGDGFYIAKFRRHD